MSSLIRHMAHIDDVVAGSFWTDGCRMIEVSNVDFDGVVKYEQYYDELMTWLPYKTAIDLFVKDANDQSFFKTSRHPQHRPMAGDVFDINGIAYEVISARLSEIVVDCVNGVRMVFNLPGFVFAFRHSSLIGSKEV